MERLRKLREEKSISQIRLSVEIGVAQETISAYERGKAVPTCENLVKMAKYLNTSSDYLLELSDVKLPYNKITLDKLSEEELLILIKYRNLTNSEKSKLCGYLDCLSNS